MVKNIGHKKDILVEVVAYNARVIHFYEKCGFVTTGGNGHHDLLPTILMRRHSKRT